MDNRSARYCAECQKTVGYSNWARHQRIHRDYGGASRRQQRRDQSAGSSGTTETSTFRVSYASTTHQRTGRRRRAFVVAPAARACARRAAELFVWGTTPATVRCRLQDELRYVPYEVREASLYATREVLGIVRRSTGPRPPDPYYGFPPSSRRRTTLAQSHESPERRVEIVNTPLTGSTSSIIPPSGRATILLGGDLTAAEAAHEVPLVLEVPESEDIFAHEQEEVQRTAGPTISSQAVDNSLEASQCQLVDPSLSACSGAGAVSDTDTERNIMEPTPEETDKPTRIALTHYRPRRSSNREPQRMEHTILDSTSAPPAIDLEAMVAAAVDSVMSTASAASVPAQEPQTTVTSAPPATATVSRGRSTVTVQSAVNTSTYRIPRINRSSATTSAAESTRDTESARSRDRRRQEEDRRQLSTDRRPERRQRDRQHQPPAPGRRSSEGSVTLGVSSGLAPPRPRPSSRDDQGQLELVRRRRAEAERELEKLRREEAHLRRRHRDC